jgi:CubicO group peptidase (beta-lactamase class C family)
MLLVHDGKLRYDETLPQLFPGFPAYGRAITVRDLLHHTSGLADYEDLMDAAHGYVPPPAAAGEAPQISDAQVLKLLEGEKGTRFPPGTRWEYSNSGYVLLGLIVEQRSGMDFADFLERRLFRPLGMTNTVLYERGRNQVMHRAYGNTLDATGWHETDQSTTSATRGDGGIYTSLEDMAKWDAALASRALLPDREMQAAWQPFALPDGKRVDYGYGWFLEPFLGHARQWHYGETIGFRTGIHRFPADHLSVVVLCNRQDAVPAELIEKMAPLYLRPTAKPRRHP